jgi:uncharacterized protein YjbJ (UPF0337 family)
MDEDRVTGTAKNVGGKIEEGIGRMTGSIVAHSRAKGQCQP